jgi:hypothetical protein
LLRQFATGIITGKQDGSQGKKHLPAGGGQDEDCLDFSGPFSIVERQIGKKEGNHMKRIIFVVGILVLAVTFTLVQAAWAYQVTGPVLEVKDDSITVQKGSEKWKIAKDKNTKITGDLKVGSKVTIEYTMSATKIDVKEAGKKAEPKKAAPKKK